jgi:MtN3 and saliva related transmembrane protein
VAWTLHGVAAMASVGQEAIGWVSSLILVVTVGQQVYNQWKIGSSKGVSRWLFIGQLAASGGFLLYSVLLKNWVFTLTNALMLLNALAGYAIVVYHRRRQSRRAT